MQNITIIIILVIIYIIYYHIIFTLLGFINVWTNQMKPRVTVLDLILISEQILMQCVTLVFYFVTISLLN